MLLNPRIPLIIRSLFVILLITRLYLTLKLNIVITKASHRTQVIQFHIQCFQAPLKFLSVYFSVSFEEVVQSYFMRSKRKAQWGGRIFLAIRRICTFYLLKCIIIIFKFYTDVETGSWSRWNIKFLCPVPTSPPLGPVLNQFIQPTVLPVLKLSLRFPLVYY
jgi:hypothetical protein